jgi:hypothetical protein
MFSEVLEYGDFKADGVTVGELIRVLREQGYTEHKTGKALALYLRLSTRGDEKSASSGQGMSIKSEEFASAKVSFVPGSRF